MKEVDYNGIGYIIKHGKGFKRCIFKQKRFKFSEKGEFYLRKKFSKFTKAGIGESVCIVIKPQFYGRKALFCWL
jgi:hypothetical protein